MSIGAVRKSITHALYRQLGHANSYVQKTRPVAVDLLENDEAYLVVFDAPGTEQEDVQVRFVNGSVRIRIDRFREFHDGYVLRFPGRSMELDGDATLPADAVVDPETATARLSEVGTLKIEIPKGQPQESAASEPEEIAIED